jgi:hypothetical protein
VKVEVEGERELIKSLRAVDRDLPKRLGAIHKRVVGPVADLAESRAPRRRGRLAGSVRALGSQKAGVVAAGRRAVPYAGPIHYGWPGHNITPQPFLTDALEAREGAVVDLYHEEIERFIDSVWIEYRP